MVAKTKMGREELLLFKIKRRLFLIGLPVEEVKWEIRKYSRCYFGTYFNKRKLIRIYPYAYSTGGKFYKFSEIIKTSIHEMCHHLQYESGYCRKYGVMHDGEFWKLYNFYIERYKNGRNN